jgi:predicted transcriptional regulator
MTVCPIAIVSGCKKCPAFSVCPLKSVIGDFKKEEETQSNPQSDEQKRD